MSDHELIDGLAVSAAGLPTDLSEWEKQERAMKIFYAKGHIICGPNGQGYRLTRDVFPGDAVKASDFEPFGGAPEPKQNEPMVDWLAEAVFGEMTDDDRKRGAGQAAPAGWEQAGRERAMKDAPAGVEVKPLEWDGKQGTYASFEFGPETVHYSVNLVDERLDAWNVETGVTGSYFGPTEVHKCIGKDAAKAATEAYHASRVAALIADAAGVEVMVLPLSALAPKDAEPVAASKGEPQRVTYTNWRGETSEREILPLYIWFGSTEWHPKPQWVITAKDIGKGVERDFALSGFTHPAPEPAGLEKAVEAAGKAIAEHMNSHGPIATKALAQAAIRAALPHLSPSPQAVDMVLDEFAKHTNWELDWGSIDPSDDTSDCVWRVHARNGGRNDREWRLIGAGDTPSAAIKAAMIAASPTDMGSEPQAVVAWRGVIDGRTVLLARDDVELERLARDYRCEIEPLVPASVVASLEARVAELEAALETFADPGNWVVNGRFDPSSGNFDATTFASAALTRLTTLPEGGAK